MHSHTNISVSYTIAVPDLRVRFDSGCTFYNILSDRIGFVVNARRCYAKFYPIKYIYFYHCYLTFFRVRTTSVATSKSVVVVNTKSLLLLSIYLI